LAASCPKITPPADADLLETNMFVMEMTAVKKLQQNSVAEKN
jgi:hypothetical protein